MRHARLHFIAALLLTIVPPLASAAEPDLPIIRINAARAIAAMPRRLFRVNLRQNMQQDPQEFPPQSQAHVLTLNGPNAQSHNDVISHQPPAIR